MKIAICDDEQIFIDATCDILKKWSQKNYIVPEIHCFTNGDDLINAQQNNCMDLIILDVLMPLLNGIDTARELRNSNQSVPIIFLTSSRDFAVDSYEVNAFNYILKPIDENRFFSVLDKFLNSFEKNMETFTAHTQTGFCKLQLEKVDYLEAQNKKVIVYLSNGTIIEIKELFSKCEDIFTIEKGFFRCHRSYIVNLKRVEQFSKTQIITYNNNMLPISRNSYLAFKEAYFSYMFNS